MPKDIPRLKKEKKEQVKEPKEPKTKGRPINKKQYPQSNSDDEFTMEESQKPVFITKGNSVKPEDNIVSPVVSFNNAPQYIPSSLHQYEEPQYLMNLKLFN